MIDDISNTLHQPIHDTVILYAEITHTIDNSITRLIITTLLRTSQKRFQSLHLIQEMSLNRSNVYNYMAVPICT